MVSFVVLDVAGLAFGAFLCTFLVLPAERRVRWGDADWAGIGRKWVVVPTGKAEGLWGFGGLGMGCVWLVMSGGVRCEELMECIPSHLLGSTFMT